MMRGISRNMILPGLIGAAVVGLGLTLLTIVARSPYTHANLNLRFDPRYTRTDQIVLGAPVPFGGHGLAQPLPTDPVERGHQLFVAEGCAACHGLDGHGGVIGPSIVGTKATKLRSVTLVGPKGMPAYSPQALSDDVLSAIAAYLDAMSK